MTSHAATFRESIHTRAAAQLRRIVLPEVNDERIIDAAIRLAGHGLARPVLIGPMAAVRDAVASRGGDAAKIEVIDPGEPELRTALASALAARRAHRGWTVAAAMDRLDDPLLFGAMLVRSGHVDGMVAGADRTTGDVIRAAAWCIGTAPGIRTLSSSFYMVVPPFRGSVSPEVLTFTDGAVVVEPTARDLADIAAAATAARRLIVGDEPRVAFLSFSTRGSADHTAVSRVREAFTLFRSEHPEVTAEGEVQADAALIEAVAARKTPGGALAGGANVLVFPSLDAGNISYKLVQRLAGADAIGPVMQGLDLPCSDLSRGATVDDIVDVACVTALQVKGMRH